MFDRMRKNGIVLSFAVAAVALLAAGTLITTLAADQISVGKVRDILQHLAGANLDKKQVEIRKISPGTGSGGVIVEARIETAFRLEKVKDDWRIAEVRLGDRQWESFELIDEAIRREKARRTTGMLKEIAESIGAYQKANGKFPECDKISELIDFIAPQFTSRVHRFDLWGREFEYRGNASSYRLISAGPDRKTGSKDDLIVENGKLQSHGDD